MQGALTQTDRDRIAFMLRSVQRNRLSGAIHATHPEKYAAKDRLKAEQAHHDSHGAYAGIRELALYLGVEY